MPTKLIYVGGLKRDTSEDDIRSHLIDVGIENFDISDVIALTSRNQNQSSFCVSLDSKEAVDIIYERGNWPTHVRIRPYMYNVHNENIRRLNREYTKKTCFNSRTQGRGRPRYNARAWYTNYDSEWPPLSHYDREESDNVYESWMDRDYHQEKDYYSSDQYWSHGWS